jgi:nitrogenase molybdenum-iron protein NifN
MIAPVRKLPSPFGRGAGSEGVAGEVNREAVSPDATALTLTLSGHRPKVDRERGPVSKAVTQNACKLCAPLGACLAFRGVEGAVPFLHGSQGCATYIRRYMISHFKEPLDIASSNFGETTAIFGGLENLREGLENVIRQYAPQLIGIASTCLAETIGDDVAFYLRQIAAEANEPLPALVRVSTPSYAGTHVEGFHATVHALVESLAQPGPRHEAINVLPGMISPADLRHLKELLSDFGLESIMLPDYSSTLDGPIWNEYQRIPPGGTPIEAIRRMSGARATIEFGSTWDRSETAGTLLEERFGVPRYELPLPIGITQTDRLTEVLSELAGCPPPANQEAERGRLIDSYVDAHKYIFGKKAVVYGEPDLVVGLASLLAEVGIVPAICASGVKSGRLAENIHTLEPELANDVMTLEGVDFTEIESHASGQKIDLAVGNSKGYGLSRRLGIPLIRAGFPIHDRVDGARLLHIGYRGAQQLFDRVVNAVIGVDQEASPVGYSYM